MKTLDFPRSGWPSGDEVRGVERAPTLGRYQVEGTLGKGTSGIVYRGKDPESGRVVAIKTLNVSRDIDPDELKELKKRFFREAEAAGRLTHPNIVKIYDSGQEQGLAYIAMELLKGRDLLQHIRPDNLLALDRVLSIIARVAEALAYAHRENVVHRDVKPANIMYEPESDTVKVTDFGIARITDASMTMAGVVLGTPSYMSPEQLAGKKIDGRSDLFSLGAVLYQMVCGRLPFQGNTMVQLMYKIANEAHGSLPEHIRGMPACVTAIVDKALAKDPGRRYQNGDEMAGALRLCLQGLPPSRAAAPVTSA